jgi:hypothetical protein
MKLVIGAIALLIAPLTALFSETTLASISASYHQGGWAQSVFVGFLFAISALLLAHNGRGRAELVLSKGASCASLGVALFPCGCGLTDTIAGKVHWISAAILFLMLAQFTREFANRARQKRYPEAKLRTAVYNTAGLAILMSMCAIAANHYLRNAMSSRFTQFVFYCEAVALTAFGVSWLTASRVIPGLTSSGERFSPLRRDNPD